MTVQTPLLQQWFEEVWNKADESAITRLLDENAVIHGLEIHKDYKGPEAFIPFYRKFRETFPSVEVQLEPLMNSGDMEAAFSHVSATVTGNKPVHFDGIVVARFKDGKLVEAWNAYDFLSMYQQMGMQLVNERELSTISVTA